MGLNELRVLVFVPIDPVADLDVDVVGIRRFGAPEAKIVKLELAKYDRFMFNTYRFR